VTFVEFHLVVPSAMRVGEAHAICDRVEAALREDVGEVRVTIHVEPEKNAKRPGVPVLS
jgi:divalent metal cation (Fe/Co/Zn/Cd) transporter